MVYHRGHLTFFKAISSLQEFADYCEFMLPSKYNQYRKCRFLAMTS